MSSAADPPDPGDPGAAVRARLLERVRRSVEQHREYLTVRRDTHHGQAVGTGVRARTLRSAATTRAEIVQLDPGTALPWPAGTSAQEVLVLGGELRPDEDAPLLRHDYLIRERGASIGLRAGLQAAELYVRQRLVPMPQLPALEAHWWQLAEGRPRLVRQAQRRWAANAPGVQVLPLWGDRDVVSMLVRFAPGASVPDHHHALDEDCLVLDGEMFLGDILLRAGDYQLAPAGGGHFGETSDVGVLFFFHGAIDPVLNRAAPR